MRTEVLAAVHYLQNFLFHNLPRRRVEAYGEAVSVLVMARLSPHWHPEQPFRDVHHRCLRVTGPHADPLFMEAAKISGLCMEEIQACLPREELCLWIDPGEVTARIGTRGETVQLLELGNIQRPSGWGVGDVSEPMTMTAFLGDFISSPELSPSNALIGTRASSSNTSSCSPSISPTAMSGTANLLPAPLFLTRNLPVVANNSIPANNYFTAATFAQTKFGSMKLRSPSKASATASPQNRPTQLPAGSNIHPCHNAGWFGEPGTTAQLMAQQQPRPPPQGLSHSVSHPFFSSPLMMPHRGDDMSPMANGPIPNATNFISKTAFAVSESCGWSCSHEDSSTTISPYPEQCASGLWLMGSRRMWRGPHPMEPDHPSSLTWSPPEETLQIAACTDELRVRIPQ